MGIQAGFVMIEGCLVLAVIGLLLHEHLSRPWWEGSLRLRWGYIMLVIVLVVLVVMRWVVGVNGG